MTLIWGLNYIAAKLVLKSFPALLVGPLRTTLAALILLPFFWYARARGTARPVGSWRETLQLSVLGLAGTTANQLCFIIGMSWTSVAHAALIGATGPLQVMALAVMRGQERISTRKLTGMLTAVAGIVLLQFDRHPGRTATWYGDLMTLLAALLFALYTVFGKEVTRRHDTMTVNVVGYLAGALVSAPLLIQQSVHFDYATVTPTAWWGLLYMAALASTFCYFVFYYALHRLPASRVAAFSYAQPVIAAVAGMALLSEPITPAIAAGGLLVLGGVWFTGRG
jgi:drug/metabolite transporter (DMT)-like permease